MEDASGTSDPGGDAAQPDVSADRNLGEARDAGGPDGSSIDASGDTDVALDQSSEADTGSADADLTDASEEGDVALDDAHEDDVAPTPDSASDAAPEADSCPLRMVLIPTTSGRGYCIDAYETTNAEYATFLESSTADILQQAECTWNVDFRPATYPACDGLFDPIARADYPIVCIDWCDAKAYCQWAGKRLCGRVGGGPSSEVIYNDPSANEWYRACTAAGTRSYPYASGFEADKCNGPLYGAGELLPVGAASGCEGGYAGLFDMVGNANEWEDLCGVRDPVTWANCSLRGQAYDSPFDTSGCNVYTYSARVGGGPTTGVRCCSDLMTPDDP
jgi:sulfatase modifying factor 1